ncbi:serine hydrolase [Schaalia sp. Marseille-Q2122]|uniref:serine hydrolase domain-containing protein n=1 Tax=Schaalia sp. Marseille-Q2122 TaxID=2736604 RepID=UPI00158BA123|nr:serine hydrolase domain-containing protein [Schaalia sp. Marseille-Q2122]
MDAQGFHARLTRHFDRSAHSWQPQVAISSPHLGIDFHYGPPDLPFHGASVGKLVTAACIMQQVESGSFTLNTPVTTILSSADLHGLFAEGHHQEVTVEHLLTHTSGVNDYFEGRATGGKLSKRALDDLDRAWSPQDLLDHTRINQRPVGKPGERFFYSDTGFVLLGRILEETSGVSFEALVHERVFSPAGMTSAFMPYRSAPQQGTSSIAPMWLGRTRVDTSPAVTVDWAGGAIAATPRDYLRLIRSLRSGTLMSRDSWEQMGTVRHRFRMGLDYGMGAMIVDFAKLSPWARRWPRLTGHLGISAAHLWHDPVHDADIVINFGSTAAMRPSFRALYEVVGALRSLNS